MVRASVITLSFAALILAGRAAAADLPVQGVFGAEPSDCEAAKAETEGGYIGFDGASTGEGGEGGCDFGTVQKTGPDRYLLTGLCSSLDGPKKRRRVTLVVVNRNEVVYDGTTYRRCPP